MHDAGARGAAHVVASVEAASTEQAAIERGKKHGDPRWAAGIRKLPKMKTTSARSAVESPPAVLKDLLEGLLEELQGRYTLHKEGQG